MEIELIWWITAIEMPTFAGLFWLIWRGRSEVHDLQDKMLSIVAVHETDMRNAINALKLEVAQNYVRASEMLHLEKRLTSHLLRIEARLDAKYYPSPALQND